MFIRIYLLTMYRHKYTQVKQFSILKILHGHCSIYHLRECTVALAKTLIR